MKYERATRLCIYYLCIYCFIRVDNLLVKPGQEAPLYLLFE